jgi:hydrogenase nickel incorporation protein HypA/HybF
MHELGLSEAILRAAEARAGGRRVREVAVTVGGAHVADQLALRTAFSMAAAGTVAEDATLEVRVDPVRLLCSSCGAETVRGTWQPPACPRCGSVDVEMVGGADVVLERITLDAG